MPRMQVARLIIGAMSGTSADGVDAALVRITGQGLGMSTQFLRLRHHPYDAELRRAIFKIRAGGPVHLEHLAKTGRQITLAYADCISALLADVNLRPAEISAVAAHGQTIYHSPPDTIQWLDPALLAARTGIMVVSDFRRADCAAGGQGAPLVPYADYILFRHPEKNRVLLNLGGIANLTYIPAGASIDQIIAFDTGPGNCISDWICRTHDPNGPGYDPAGQSAARGKAHLSVALAMAESEYMTRPPPKSTDGPAMIQLFERCAQSAGAPAGFEDMLATASLAAATCMAKAFALFISRRNLEVFVSGGGTKNHQLMVDLQEALNWWTPQVRPLEGKDVVDAKEAIAFALLAAATLDGEPSNVPACTGAKSQVILGSLTPIP